MRRRIPPLCVAALVGVAVLRTTAAAPGSSVVHATQLLESTSRPEPTEADLAGLLRVAARSAQSEGSERAAVIAGELATTHRRRDVIGAWIVEPASVGVGPAAEGLQDRRNAAVQAVKALRIVGVCADRRECYVGPWSIRAGDSITIQHNAQNFTFTISSVTAASVVFEDASSRSRIVARLHLVPNDAPPEMQPLR